MSRYYSQINDIVRLFRAGLGRNPEIAAVNSFLTLIDEGGSFHDLAHAIAGSPEFRDKHGAEDRCDRRFVHFLYRHGLDRKPDLLAEQALLALSSRGDALERVAGSAKARRLTRKLLPVLFPEGVPLGDDLAYRLWLRERASLTRKDRRKMSLAIEQGTDRCRFGLMILARDERVDLLMETVGSLEAQLHSDWTLKVVCSAEAPIAVRDAIDGLCRRVPGVSTRLVPAHQGQGERWQAALEASDAEFCAFLYPGDRLAPDALHRFASAIAAHPGADLLYSDEDSLDSDGMRSNPRFKPGWFRDMLYAGDITGQLTVFRRERALRAGGIRHDAGEFCRYDLMLRITERLAAGAIRHIPHVLYHRGRGPGREVGFPRIRATFQHPDLMAVVQRHLAEARPELETSSVYVGGSVWPRIAYPMPSSPPLVSVIIPTRDQGAMLDRCVRGLLNDTDYPRIEILIADNDSRDVKTVETLRRLARDPRVTTERQSGAFNWSAINNRMAAHARGELLLFLNDDTVVLQPDWLSELVRQVSQPAVGIAGARLLYRDGTVQHAGIAMTATGARHILRAARDDVSGYMGQIALARDVSAVTGACMLVRREVFTGLGGFDESFPLTCNDIEFCVRARGHGHRVVWTPHAVLTHVDGATRGRDITAAQIVRSCLDNGRLLDRLDPSVPADPYLNANLAVTDYEMFLFTPERNPEGKVPDDLKPRRKRTKAAPGGPDESGDDETGEDEKEDAEQSVDA